MKVIDTGHTYYLDKLDDNLEAPHYPLIFVKREGQKYPGNTGHYPGTNLQEVFRVCIDRLKYLQVQEPCIENNNIIISLRDSIRQLEIRAAARHNLPLPEEISMECIELAITCNFCGHIGHSEDFHAQVGHR